MTTSNDLRRLLHDLRDALTPAHAIIKSRGHRPLSEPDFAIIDESLAAAFATLDTVATTLSTSPAFARYPKWRHVTKDVVYEEIVRYHDGWLQLRNISDSSLTRNHERDLLAAGFRRYDKHGGPT